MRITFILRSLDRGGGNRMVAMHAAGLRARGHSVQVVASWNPPAAATRFGRWLAATFGPDAVRPTAPPSSHLDSHGIVPQLTALPGRLQAHEVPDADVVVATWWETAEWVQALPPSKGAPAYFVQHYEAFEYMPRERVDATYRAPLHRIAVAPWLVDKLRDDFGDDVVDLVPNAVDATRFDAPVREPQLRPTVGFMYSNTPFKGAGTALRAIRRLRDTVPGLRAIGFGPVDLHTEVPGTDWIEYATAPPEDRIPGLYAAVDAWICTSISEGFNLPALEAMACRTPVISTRTGWPADALIDGVNGYLCEVGDADAIAERTRDVLLAGEAQWKAMSAAAHRTAHAVSREQSTALFEAALRRAIERQSPPRHPGRGSPWAVPSLGTAPLTRPMQLR